MFEKRPLVNILWGSFKVFTTASTMNAFKMNCFIFFNCVLALPTVIEIPRVKIINENFDTPNRQFPVGTTITLTCQGEVGSDPSKV